MSQTAEQLIDSLTTAVFKAAPDGTVTLTKELVIEIGRHLRMLVGDELKTLATKMRLTPRETELYGLLSAMPNVPVRTSQILQSTRIPTESSLWVHKRRLIEKLEHHPEAGIVVNVRDYGYMFIPAADQEGAHVASA